MAKFMKDKMREAIPDFNEYVQVPSDSLYFYFLRHTNLSTIYHLFALLLTQLVPPTNLLLSISLLNPVHTTNSNLKTDLTLFHVFSTYPHTFFLKATD